VEGTADLDVFAANPAGRYLVGGDWIHWCEADDLFGVILWGAPDRDSVSRLTRSLALELEPGRAPHRSIVDASRLERVDGEGFEVLAGYVRARHQDLSQYVTRLALVRPEGAVGAAVAGFYAVLDAPYEVELFEDPGAARQWLLDDGDKAARLGKELDRICAAVMDVPPLVAALRAVILAEIQHVDLARAARAMRVSERSLQRKLKEHDTTFGAEVLAVRIAEAKRRMLEGDGSLTRIALDVGFPSLSHFSARFRQIVGVAPSVWRQSESG
jgi:AraC-like DNA-binding protein